eukprot:TRINITY_DN4940_c0_g1_i1.p1 TRINITY_DN4940_c0_g1~~TRINITY_DN4940_c0_g1_i1.p1  ORF type:complete len:258 (-),score=59.36 TRINITY_DN4940_c0_g1_i1:312-1025(-)
MAHRAALLLSHVGGAHPPPADAAPAALSPCSGSEGPAVWEDGYGVANADMRAMVQEMQRHVSESPPAPSTSFTALKAQEGTEIGVGRWFEVSQPRVDAFAVATGDPQWIHTAEAAEKGSPFGRPIAHGYLVLSLTSMLAQPLMPKVEGALMGVNYGLNKVRWVSPVPVGARVRMRVTLKELRGIPARGGQGPAAQCTWALTLENEKGRASAEAHKTPACLAEWITRIYFAPGTALEG